MRMRLDFELRPDASTVDVDQFFTWARRLEAPPVMLQAFTGLDEAVHAPIQVARESNMSDLSAGLLSPTPLTGQMTADPTWQPPVSGGLTNGEAAAGAAPPVEAPKRRGRRSTADRAVEIAAQAAAEVAAAGQPEATPPTGSFGGALPPGIAMPPGVAAAAAAPSAPAPAPVIPAPVAPPAAAMPVAPPAAPPVAGAPMTLEDFKAEALAMHSEASSRGLIMTASPINRMRNPNWLDGTPKGWNTLNVDAVPAADRQRIINECLEVLTRG
jgi:hypothetical protein